MALQLDVLTERRLIATDEALSVQVYAHDGFVPAAALTIGFTVLDSTGATVNTGSLTESGSFSGLYEAAVEPVTPLVPGVYTVVLVQSGVPVTQLVQVEKGPDLAAAELGLESNIQREFVIAQQAIPVRNVVAGAVEGFQFRVKRSSDVDFSSPVVEQFMAFTYKSASPQSDIVLVTPGTPSSVVPAPEVFPYVNRFETQDWATIPQVLDRTITGSPGERIVTAADVADYVPLSLVSANYLEFEEFTVGDVVDIIHPEGIQDTDQFLFSRFDDPDGIDLVSRKIDADTMYRVRMSIEPATDDLNLELFRHTLGAGVVSLGTSAVTVPDLLWVGVRLKVIDNASVTDEIRLVVEHSLTAGSVWNTDLDLTDPDLAEAVDLYSKDGMNGWKIASTSATPKAFSFDQWEIRGT